jgi:hypothetical protein
MAGTVMLTHKGQQRPQREERGGEEGGGKGSCHLIEKLYYVFSEN